MSGSLGNVDTSIYQTIKAPPPGGDAAAAPNPLAMMQGLTSIQHTALENNQMMQMQNAKLAIGQAAQAAVDPTTGQIDENKFISNVGQDPRSAYMMQDMMNAQAARQLQQAQTSTSDMNRGLQISEAMTQGLGTLIPKPDITREDIYDITRQYLSMAPHGEAVPLAMNFLKELSQVAGPPPAPGQPETPQAQQAMRQLLIQKQLAFTNTANTLKMVLPQFQTSRNANGEIVFNPNVLTAPGLDNPANPIHTGTLLAGGASPEVLAGNQQGKDAAGNTVSVPNSTAIAARGGNVYPGIVNAGQPLPGPLSSAAGVPQPIAAPQGGRQNPGVSPPQNPLGWGQGAPSGAGPVAPPAPALPQPAKAPGAFDPVIPPPMGGIPDPAKAIASGQPVVAELGPGQKAMQEQAAQNWQDGRKALTNTVAGDQTATQAILAEEKASQDFASGPGTETALALAHRLKAASMALSGVPGAQSISDLADNIIKNPNNPGAVQQAQSAAQAFSALNLSSVIGQFQKNFTANGGPGSEGEFNKLAENWVNASSTSGARATIYGFAKQLAAYDLAKSQAAQIYENKAQAQGTTPNFNDFSTQWTQHAQQHGFGASGDPGTGVISAPGNAPSLLQSVGLDPNAVDHQTAAMPKPMRGTAKINGKPVTGLWQQGPDGSLSLLKAD